MLEHQVLKVDLPYKLEKIWRLPLERYGLAYSMEWLPKSFPEHRVVDTIPI